MAEKFTIPLEEVVKNSEVIKNDPVGFFLKKLEERPEFAEIKPADVDLSYLSPEERAESLWAIFQNIKSLLSGRRKEKNIEEGNLPASFRGSLALLKKLSNDRETKIAFKKASTRELREINDINGDYEKYIALEKQINEAEKTTDSAARGIFSKRGEGVNEADIIIFETNKRRATELRETMTILIENNPQLASLAQFRLLSEYSRQQRNERFIWSPTRRQLLEEIETAALGGKPVLISGESGVGKTRLVEQVALILTGQPNSETPGKDVRFQDLIAKPKISASGQTYYEFKEIGEAVTGKRNTLDEKPTHGGLVVADDEFNLLDVSEQNTRLSRVSSWTPGKRIRMPVTNTEETVAPDFLYCAMVNLASERYSRNKIPPEVLRKFAKVDVDYPEQTENNPEIYEMMLATLMDENGRLRAPKDEIVPEYEYEEKLNQEIENAHGQKIKATLKIRTLVNEKTEGKKKIKAGGFLWRFAQVINEINKSFSHKETVLKSRADAQFLKDLIIDMGTVLGWLKEYATFGRGSALEPFIIEKLNKEFLSKSAYNTEDRQLVKDFLDFFGIKTDVKIDTNKQKAKFENLSTLDIGLLSPRVRYREIVHQEPILTEGYYVNTDGERVEYFIKEIESSEGKYVPGQIVNFGFRNFEFYGVDKKTGQPVFLEARKETKGAVSKKTVEHPQELTPQIESIMQKTEALNRAVFGNLYDSLFPETLPIPNFSPETLEFIEKNELFPYYLPEIDFMDLSNVLNPKSDPELIKLTKDTDLNDYYTNLTSLFPNWYLPSKELFNLAQKYITTGGKEGVSPDSLKLTNQWVFIETAEKPQYNNGKQEYPKTELMKQVATLMNQDDIHYVKDGANIYIGTKIALGSRFSLTWPEITGIKVDNKGITELNPITNQPIHTNQGIVDYAEKVLNTKVSLPTNLQWNLLANMLIHNQNQEANLPIQKLDPKSGLGSTNTLEWDLDKKSYSDGPVGRLLSGFSVGGGLSSVYGSGPLDRCDYFGFRLLGNG